MISRGFSFANGEYNDELEVEATQYGLELSLGVVIEWEWIFAAARTLRLSFAEDLPPSPEHDNNA